MPAGGLLAGAACSPALAKAMMLLEGCNRFAHSNPMLYKHTAHVPWSHSPFPIVEQLEELDTFPEFPMG